MLQALRNCFFKEEVNTGRQLELDIAKGFAIIFMVWVHVFEELSPSTSGGLYTLTEIFGGPFAAPVFMICMGIGMGFSRNNAPKDLFKRGLSLLWVGLILNVCRFVIPDLIKYAGTGNSAYLYDTIQMFSVDILQFAGLAFLFFALAKKLKLNNIVLVVVGLGASVLGMLLSSISSGNTLADMFLGYIWGTANWSYFPFLSWIIFPIYGYIFSTFLRRCIDKRKAYLIITPLCLVIMLGYAYITATKGLMYFSNGSYYHLSVVDSVFFCVLGTLVFGICFWLTQLLSRCGFVTFCRFSKNINTIYCIHWVLIGILGVVQCLVFGTTTLKFATGTIIAILLIVVSDRIAALWLGRLKPVIKEKQRINSIGKGMVVALVAFGIAVFVYGQLPQKKVSDPFNYSGYSSQVYKSYLKSSEYVEMSDGTKIAVDVYMPQGGPKQSSYPVIFQYTPYGRAFALPDTSLIDKIKMRIGVGAFSDVLDRANSHDTMYGSSDATVQTFLSYGYAYVCADMRGTGASFGSKVDFLPTFADDGKELVDWMSEQSWCDGNVGMFGGSYLGYSQLVTASKQPEALKCIIPEVTAFDGYTGEIRPGGIFLWSYAQQETQQLLEQNQYLPDSYVYPTAPAVDEDGDGEYTDEIPIDKNGNGSFLDDYNFPDDPTDEPEYADGQSRNHLYYLATKEHLNNIPYSSLGPNAECIDTTLSFGDFEGSAYTVSPVANIDGIMDSDIAVYSHGGWMDAFTRGNTEIYSTLKDTNESRLVIDPGYHMGTSPFWEYCGEDEDSSVAAYATEWLRFYDHYLKGIDNGIDTEDPVLIYNMNGDGWRTESEWPLERQQEKEFYLNDNEELSEKTESESVDNYTVDFTCKSDWGTDYAQNRWVMETPDSLPYRTEEDEKCLTYTTDALKVDTEVTGYPIVDIYVSSTADTGDFYFYLEDVDESGDALLVTEGQLNASFANLYDNDAMILGGTKGIDVLPNLPWHGYETSEKNDQVFADGNIVELKLDLMPTSWVFKEGHSIRLSIACANNEIFELTPSLAPNNDANDTENICPDITIYRDSRHPSKITLPIIPR